MLTYPDFLEKQIVIIFADELKKNSLNFSNDNLVFKKENKIENQLSCFKILSLFIVGDFTISTPLIRNCKKYGISLFFLKSNFEVYAEINSKSEANYLLREKQYKSIDDFEKAKKLIENKITNQLMLLKEKGKLKDYKKNIKKYKEKLLMCSTEKELLGLEGSVSRYYFQTLFNEYNWYKRMPRAKVDEINLLMDVGYTFLFNFVGALLSLYGFDLYKGFYHTLYFGRKSLPCDLVEPFRCLIDKQIIKSFNLKQFQKSDFRVKKGRYYLSFDKQKKYSLIFLECLMDNKEDIFLYIKEYYRCIMHDKEFPFYKYK